MSPNSVVLDACVLVPFPLCDTLLRGAQKGLYLARWSNDILAEVERTLITKLSIPPEKARYRIEMIERAFPESNVGERYRALIPTIDIDCEDRHVVAAALFSRSETIVTANIRHFPAHTMSELGISAEHPDFFLTKLIESDPKTLIRVLTEQAAATRSPRLPVRQIVENLRNDAPTFAESALKILG